MIKKKLTELLDVSTISQDKTWSDLVKSIKELDISQGIDIDMSGVNILNPWNMEHFLDFLAIPNMYLTFTNKKDLVTRIKMICIMNGYNDDNIFNIEMETDKKETAAEIKLKKDSAEMKKYFKLEDDSYVFNVKDKYTQLFSSSTVDILESTINRIEAETGVKNYILKASDVPMQDIVINRLSALMLKYSTSGIKLKIDTDIDEIKNKFRLYLFKNSNQNYSEEDRIKIINNNYKPGTPGMLMRYRKGRALDDFGRYGNGEIISSRVAIFRGIETDDFGSKYVVIDSYSNDTFYTKQHWSVDHDNEELDELVYDTHKIPLLDIGMQSFFLGTTFHFIKPIQQNINENVTVIKDFDENGSNIKQVCTIPERMKIVFDNWGVDYDKELLDSYIKETKELLENK